MIATKAVCSKKYDSPSSLVSWIFFRVENIFDFQEGQFVMIEREINGQIIKKPYSLASTNQQLQEKKEISVVVKKASEAGMSNWLTQEIQIGDKVEIKGPLGHYVDPGTNPNYLLISVGSGLSPNFALFQQLVYEKKSYNKIVNIFGERYYRHIVPEIEELFLDHGQDNITNLLYLSKDEKITNSSPLWRGDTDGVGRRVYFPGHVQSWLKQAIDILGTQTTCFICGIPAMVDEVRRKLEKMGIDKENIFFEKY